MLPLDPRRGPPPGPPGDPLHGQPGGLLPAPFLETLRPGAGWAGFPAGEATVTPPDDPVLEAFLETQLEEGLRLAAESDLLEVVPQAGPEGAPRRYLVNFRAKSLVRDPATGNIAEMEGFTAGICFCPDHLHFAEPFRTVAWLAPPHAFHPNIRWPFICVGRIAAGTSLVDLIYQIGDIATYRKLTTREDDALNKEACAWARRQPPDLFPIDRRPLKRNAVILEIEEVSGEAGR